MRALLHIRGMKLASSAVLALLATMTGCLNQSYEDGAKEKFAKEVSCQQTSVELRKRPELDAYDLAWGKSAPPAEVAKDPARLAVWQKEESDRRASYAGNPVFELRGCGHQVLYTCTRANVGRTSGAVMCSEHDYPPGVTRW